MALLSWNEKYSVGVKQFDDQHKKLFELLNTLYDAMTAGKGKEVLGPVLSQLADYTVMHFKMEEESFKKYAYPAQLEHKQEHDALTKQVLEFKNKFASGNAFITTELMNFLKGWLNHHIMEVDKKYGRHFNSKGLK